MTAPRLGSLWRLEPRHGGHVVLVATADAERHAHALLAVDRDAGPEDVVVGPGAVCWLGMPAAVRAIACRQQAVVVLDWLFEELGELGREECDAAGWLSAPPPVRAGIRRPGPGLVGSAYTDVDDPRLAAVRHEAAIARDLVDAASPGRAAAGARRRLAPIGQIGDRLLDAAASLIKGAAEVFSAQLRPAPVLRGPLRGADDVGEGPPARRAVLEIPDEGFALLGERVRSRLVVGGGSVRIWLTDLSRLSDADVVVVIAMPSSGVPVQARATLESGSTRMRLDMPWPDEEPPSRLALAVVRQ